MTISKKLLSMVLAFFPMTMSAHAASMTSGDFVSPGCSNYVFTANTGSIAQQLMLLMLPPPSIKYQAHIHVHALSGTPTVSIMGMDAKNSMTHVLGDTALDASNINLADVDVNINKGMDYVVLPKGNMVILNVSAPSSTPASIFVFVDRCVSS